MKRYRNYINGQRTEDGGSAYFAVYDPSTEEVIAEVAEAAAADVDAAVQSARFHTLPA